jgi:nucleotide-binding universal stress UspA family protein
VNRLPNEETAKIDAAINKEITQNQEADGMPRVRTMIIENSFDPAKDILNIANETNVDLVVMKARPGVLSALHFSSIVERVVRRAACPVLLLPSKFIDERSSAAEGPEFRRILFDYDFSFATDELFRAAGALTRGYDAELHMLSVLEPPRASPRGLAFAGTSPALLQSAVRAKLDGALRGCTAGPGTALAVQWGSHAETVLRYAREHSIDLICTTLAQPSLSVEKLYRVYLGELLRSSRCPVLVKQSV